MDTLPSTPSRRAALALIAATPVAGLPTVSGGDDLAGLVEAHKAAYAAWEAALSRLGAAEEAYLAKREPFKIPVSTGHVLEENAFSCKADCREQVSGFYAAAAVALRTMKRLAPEIAEQYAAALKLAERDNLDLVDRIFAEEEARRDAFGLTAARDVESAAEDAEETALMALLAYPAKSFEEAKRKASYLSTTRYSDRLDKEGLAFLQSFINGTAS